MADSRPEIRFTGGLLLLLAGCSGLGSIAIHMFVPAMPVVARDLHSNENMVQLAITLYLIGVGVGQLVAGPISDRLGRRPVLLGGLGFFMAGSVLSAVAPNAEVLVLARVLQSFGGATGLNVARSVVSDLSTPKEAVTRLATLVSVVLLSPAIAPVVGGVIASLAGWRAIFVLLAVAALGAFVAAAKLLPETLSPRERPPSSLREDYRRLLSNARLRRFAVSMTTATCALYIFLTSSAFLLIGRYGLTPGQAGLCYLVVSGAGIIGASSVGLLERFGGAFRWGVSAVAIGGGIMLGLAAAGFEGVVPLVAPMMIAAFGACTCAPSGMAGVMHAEEGLAGTASSLIGALQMLGSGIVTTVVTHLGHASPLGVSAGIFVAGMIGFVVAPRARTN